MSARRAVGLSTEDGKSLAAALIVLAVGLILIVPLLSSSSTGLLRTRAADGALLQQYTLDAGIEYGIWKLRYDGAFRASVDATPMTPVNVTPAMTLNGIAPSITATALVTSGWDTSLTPTPNDVVAGAALVYAASGGQDYLFAMRGNGHDFWRYSISGDIWVPRADTIDDTAQGAALAWDGGNFIYAFRGANTDTFWRYSITGDAWAPLHDAPARVRNGGSLAYAGGYIYALRGNNTPDFWRFNTASLSWDPSPLPDALGDVNGGGALVYVGSNTFFALRGDGTNFFWRYVQGSGWVSRANLLGNANNGAALAYSGGDTIYAFRGGNSTSFYRYSISGNSWTADDNAPGTVQNGGSLAYPGGDYVYGLRGDSSPDFWRHRAVPPRYDIVAQAAGRTTTVRIQISGSSVTVLWWDLQ